MKFHIVLTEADADIICFKRSLPKGKFNETVRKILWNATKGRVADIPMSFDIDCTMTKLHTKIGLNEDLVQNCYENLGFEPNKFTTSVKAEIRKCIQKNLRTKTDRIPLVTVQQMFADALALAEAKKQERVDDGCGLSLYPYREAMDFLLDEIQNSISKGGDENDR